MERDVVRKSASSKAFSGLVGILGVCVLAIAGCGPAGPATIPVSGTVTKGGQPIAFVTVTLMGTDGNFIPTGESDASGKFTIALAPSGKKGAMPGKYKVVLAGGTNAPITSTPDKPYNPYGSGQAPKAVEKPYGKEWEAEATSPLEVEVKSGMSPIEIKL